MIYFDHNATTPVLPEAAAAMQPWLSEHYGNPSSVHRAGRLARQAVEEAREQVAALVGAQASEVIFTSGGTEADNLALHSVGGLGARLLVGATEHAAVLEAASARAGQGLELDILPVDQNGLIAQSSLAERLRRDVPQLVSIMWANNESGVIQDIAALGDCAQRAGALMHTDAVQAAGKLPIDFAASPVDLLSLSAHKIYGPKGVGALVRKRHVGIAPMLRGGGHEGGLRAGTENLPGIVGFGAAARSARLELEQRQAHVLGLRTRLEAGLAQMPQVRLFAASVPRVANTCQFGLQGFQSEALLMAFDQRGIAVASGSACHAGSGKPTHVLLAMGYDEDTAHSAIRVSLGQQNTAAEVDRFLSELDDILRQQAPAYAAGLFAS